MHGTINIIYTKYNLTAHSTHGQAKEGSGFWKGYLFYVD